MSRRSLRHLGRLCLALALCSACLPSADAGSKLPLEEQVQTALNKAQFLQEALTLHLDSTRSSELSTVTGPEQRAARANTAEAPQRPDREAFAAKRARQHAQRSLDRIDHLLTIAESVRDHDAAGALRRIEAAVREAKMAEKRLGIEFITEEQLEVSR